MEKIIHLEDADMRTIETYLEAPSGRRVHQLMTRHMQKYAIIRITTKTDVYALEIISDTQPRAFVIRKSINAKTIEKIGSAKIPLCLTQEKRYRLGNHVMYSIIQSIDILTE